MADRQRRARLQPGGRCSPACSRLWRRRRLALRARPGTARRLGCGRPLRLPHLPGERGASAQHPLPRLHAPRASNVCSRTADGRASARVVQLAGLMLLQGLSANYHLLYGVLLVGLVTLAVRRRVRPRRCSRLPVLLLAAVWRRSAYAPIALPYLRLARRTASRELPVGVDLAAFRLHHADQPALRRHRRRGAATAAGTPLRRASSVALALAGVGAWVLRRDREDAAGRSLPSSGVGARRRRPRRGLRAPSLWEGSRRLRPGARPRPLPSALLLGARLRTWCASPSG